MINIEIRKFLLKSLVCSCFISGCCSTPTPNEDKFSDCEDMSETLKADFEATLQLGIPGFGAGGSVSIDYANSLTEQRLVSMRAMIDACRKHARGESDDETYQETLLKLGGVYAVNDQVADVDQAVVLLDQRLTTLSVAFRMGGATLSNGERSIMRRNTLSISESRDPIITMREANDAVLVDEVSASDMRTDIRYDRLERRLDEIETKNSTLSSAYYSTLENWGSSETKIKSFLENFTFNQDTITISVLFDFREAELNAAARQILDEVSSEFGGNASATIVAYADIIGGAEYNLALATRRAKATADYLSSRGLNVQFSSGAGRTNSFGESNTDNRVALIFLRPERRENVIDTPLN